MNSRRVISQARRRTPKAVIPVGGFTPTLLGIGPTVTAVESLFLSRRLTVTITLGGVLGVALFTAFDGTNTYAGLGAIGSVALPGLLAAVTLQFSAGTYTAGQIYTGVV